MMLSSTFMYALIVFYVLIALTSAYETNYPRCLYWVSAAGITSAVLWMK